MIKNKTLSELFAVALLTLGLVGGAFFAFLTQTLLARTLSVEEFGILASCLSLVSVFAPAAAFGIPQLLLREFGLYGSGAQAAAKVSFGVLLLGAPCICLVIIGAGYVAWGNETKYFEILCYVSLWVVLIALQNFSVVRFQLEEMYKKLSLLHLLPHASRLVVALFVFYKCGDILMVARGYLATSVIAIVICMLVAWKLAQGKVKLVGHSDKDNLQIKKYKPQLVLRDSTPFAVANFFSMVYMASGTFWVSIFSDGESAAYFSVANSLRALVFLFPSALFTQYLVPKQHRWAAHNKKLFLETYRFFNLAMLLAGIAVMLVFYVAAPFGIKLLFGPKYEAASYVVQLFSIAIPLRFLSASVGSCLLTRDNIKHKVKYQCFVAVISIFLYCSMISVWDLTGGVIAMISCEMLLVFVYLWGARVHVFGANAWKGWHLKWSSLHA